MFVEAEEILNANGCGGVVSLVVERRGSTCWQGENRRGKFVDLCALRPRELCPQHGHQIERLEVGGALGPVEERCEPLIE